MTRREKGDASSQVGCCRAPNGHTAASVTDALGHVTSFANDDADRLTSVTDAANNVTQYAYDTENNLTSITDANNHATTFNYDAFGRVTQTTFPSNQLETYAGVYPERRVAQPWSSVRDRTRRGVHTSHPSHLRLS